MSRPVAEYRVVMTVRADGELPGGAHPDPRVRRRRGPKRVSREGIGFEDISMALLCPGATERGSHRWSMRTQGRVGKGGNPSRTFTVVSASCRLVGLDPPPPPPLFSCEILRGLPGTRPARSHQAATCSSPLGPETGLEDMWLDVTVQCDGGV